MRLEVERTAPDLRPHTVVNGYLLASRGYKVFRSIDYGKTWEICGQLPVPRWKSLLSNSRLAGRLLRMSISQIVQVSEDKLLLCCDKSLFVSDLSFCRRDIKKVDIPIRCFQLLDNSICVSAGNVYYGEYFPNPRRDEVRIFRSRDGLHWETIYSFPKGSIKHVHVLQYDSFSNKIWFSTGDADAECVLGFADLDFSNLHVVGRNSQRWRALEFLFTEDKVYWGMDTPLAQSRLIVYERRNGRVEEIGGFDGPIYNLRRIGEQGYVIVTAAERGIGEWDNKAHIWYSPNLYDWEDCISFQKDSLPNKFGFGRLLLARNTGDRIAVCGLALRGIDNKLLMLRLAP